MDDSRAFSVEAAAPAGRTGETSAMNLYFGPTNVAIWQVGIEADGGDPGRAAVIARAANRRSFRPASGRFYYADIARA
jgi:hypothetical protein